MDLSVTQKNSLIATEIARSGGVENYLKAQQHKGLLRFLTCGNVDDGKSTLIGRLLHDTRQIYEDQLSTLKNDSNKIGTQGDKLDLALLVDGLAAEREQGITIDVAYRYFSTAKRKFIIADTPGHAQYTRNMVTGASTCLLAVLLIDARKGLQEQTRRHSFITTLLGIRHLVVAINKMDLVEHQQSVFSSIQQDYLQFTKQLPSDLTIEFVPISALDGDNVVYPSLNMPWYTGKTLLALLEDAPVKLARQSQFLRFPVQYINRPNLDFRGYSGTVSSGYLYQGQHIKVLPSGLCSSIKQIITFDGSLTRAEAGQAITLVLTDDIDISRGDVIVDAHDSSAQVKHHALLDIVWMSEQSLTRDQRLDIKVAGKKSHAKILDIRYQVDINQLTQQATESLALNSIGRVEVLFEEPLVLDNYQLNRQTGGIIFIDRLTNSTVAAGLIREILDNPLSTTTPYDAFDTKLESTDSFLFSSLTCKRSAKKEIIKTAQDVIWHQHQIGLKEREAKQAHKGCVLWFTGLSGAGKSTLADALEQTLFQRSTIHAPIRTYLLDGDNLRHGLCADLGFSEQDRHENIRRVGEVAKLMVDAGLIVLTALISPYQRDRQRVRERFEQGQFIEIFVDTPLALCETRDPKGLYQQARLGKIRLFPGIDSVYERPVAPEIHLDGSRPIEELIQQILTYLQQQIYR